MKTIVKYIALTLAFVSLSISSFALVTTSVTLAIGGTKSVTPSDNISTVDLTWTPKNDGDPSIATVVVTGHGRKPTVSVTGVGVGSTSYSIVNNDTSGPDRGNNLVINITVTSEPFTVDGINYAAITTSNNKLSVVSGVYSGEIVIPAQVTYSSVTYDVVAIADEAFKTSYDLSSIVIKSNSMLSLGSNPFFLESNVKVYVPACVAHEYYTDPNWSVFGNNIGICMEVSSSGYATLFCEKNLIVPTGAQVFCYQYDSTSGKLYSNEAIPSPSIIPANVGYVVKAAAGTYKFRSTTASAITCSSVLSGSVTPLAATPSGEVYVLGNISGTTTFYKYTGTGIPAGKAYFVKP